MSAGEFQKDPNQDHCDPCQKGSFGNSTKATKCYECAPAYFTNVTRMTSCYACEAGKFGMSAGASGCSACHAGTASNAIAFVPGKSETCPNCVAGRYSASIGATICDECAAGQFNHNKGNQHCTPCAAGHASNVTGLDATSCPPCVEGVICVIYGFVCLMLIPTKIPYLCLAGSFSNRTGESECKLCPLGRFSCPTAGSYNMPRIDPATIYL